MELKNNISFINNLLLVSAFLLPIIYLVVISLKRKNKKIKIGYYLVAITIFIGILFIRWGVNKIDTYLDNENKVSKEIDNEEVDNVEKDPNYVGTTSKGYIIKNINGAYYIDDYLIVNKSYSLDSLWIPVNTYIDIEDMEKCHKCIDKEAYNKWLEMKSDSDAIGLKLYIASGYRSYGYQKDLYQKYLLKDGVELTDTYSARPGHSEHQSGLAFDLNSVDSSFAATNEGRWIKENAHLYGFIIRYPQDKTNETGYKYEPWHLRYVGLKLAKELYNNGDSLTMESYFGIDSKYK